MNVRVFGMIPARLAATRLPNKPLIDIAGKPMIQHVWERARQARGVENVVVATPDEAIARVVAAFGGQAVMTSHAHRSGTDRVAEAATRLELPPEAIVINIQGDEPLLDPEAIEAVIQPLLQDATLPMSSLMCPCPEYDLDSPACVKVVTALNGDALYFSRARLPFMRNPSGGATVMQHVGLYAYRRHFLSTFATLPPTPLEQTEALEQLRALEHGYRIRMVRVETAPVGVDTPEDLERARQLLAPHNASLSGDF
ncbi:MAG: 3-deoxy-manno-octulosonate cytidylyltransferase [Chloroherpetonaceae bacterium]|nr:3-deoxy-manno-octulosonate cytidylyltransferase [Chthonomonadaceae bacterium]MDW8206350.1 3-deoxy-manno-octulosonate cytidylyltransferase [Chloroherpetonaceae bacterium]